MPKMVPFHRAIHNLTEFNGMAVEMPEEFRHRAITFRDILTHRSGIGHNDSELTREEGGKTVFNLKFEPGTDFTYSTPAFGVLGDLLCTIDGHGRDYDALVRQYIAEPVGGSESFTAVPLYGDRGFYYSPGAYVLSNVRDMARFSLGVMSGTFYSEEVLYNEIAVHHGNDFGLGWFLKGEGDDLVMYHGGNNILPKAMIMMKPRKRLSVNFLLMSKDSEWDNRIEIADRIMALIDPD